MYTQNHGKAGVVYILQNELLKEGLFKIGQSTRSGTDRANDLNKAASTGLPAGYRCIFEYKTQDCGRAERRAHELLQAHRRGKWGQEFFEIDIESAKSAIIQACDEFNTKGNVKTSDSFKTHTSKSARKSPSITQATIQAEPQPQLNENRLNESNAQQRNESNKPSAFIWPITLIILVGILKLVRELFR